MPRHVFALAAMAPSDHHARAWLLSLFCIGRCSAQLIIPPPLLEISPPKLSEELLRAPGIKEVNFTLIGGSGWAVEIGDDVEATTFWLAKAVLGGGGGLPQQYGWDVTVAPHLRPYHVKRVVGDPNQLTLLLAGFDGVSGRYPAYDVWIPEAVSILAPYWATADNVSAVPRYANLTIDVSVPRVAVRGELVDGAVVRVADLRRRAHTLELVLDGCDWKLDAGRPGSAAFVALSRALVGPNDGVGMIAGEAGWQLAGSGQLLATRVNASHLTLTVPPLPAYSIASPETVVITVPGPALLQHHSTLPALGSFVVLATPGSASLGGSLLHKNATTRLEPPRVGGKTLEVRLLADSWVSTLSSDGALRRKVVEGMRSAQSELVGWNALVDAELAREGSVLVPATATRNATRVPIGLGNLSLSVVDERTLQLTLPAASSYAPRAPETITVTVPADALTSAADDVIASPALRIDAAAGSASVSGTFIRDTLPASYVNETTRRSITLELPPPEATAHGHSYGWWPELPFADSPPTLELLARLVQTLLSVNDTQYDVFDNICFNTSIEMPNVTHATNATNTTAIMAYNASSAAGVLHALVNLTSNATSFVNATNGSALLHQLVNLTNATGSFAAGADFCLSLINASVVNGSLVVHSQEYSPYCDPCLSVRTIKPRPFNHTSLQLLSNTTMVVEVPDAADVRTRAAVNVTLPPSALVQLPSMEPAPSNLWPPLQLELSVLVEQQTVTVPSNVFFGHNDEASLRTGPEVDSALGGSYTLDIELTDDSWQLNISSPMGAAGAGMDLILGLGSAQSEPNGWNNVVRRRLATEPGVLERVSDTLLRVRLSGFAEYDILAVETVVVTVPGSAVVSERVIEASPAVPIYPVGGSATLSGTCSSVREEVVRSLQSCTIDVTLEDDGWVSGLDGPAGEALVRGLQAVVQQPGGWDKASTGVLSAKSIAVFDATHLSVTVPQMASLDILSAQEIRLVVPPSAVLSNQGFTSNNTIRILPSAGQASLSGTLLQSLDEATLRGGGGASGGGGQATMELVISLSGDSFVPFAEVNNSAGDALSLLNATNATLGNASPLASSGGSIDSLRLALLAGISSSSDDAGGWNSAVQPLLTPSNVERVSDKVLRVSVSAAPDYSIDQPCVGSPRTLDASPLCAAYR